MISSSASFLAAVVTSKIASHELDTFLEVGEALLKVFYVFGHVVWMKDIVLHGGPVTKPARLANRGQRRKNADPSTATRLALQNNSSDSILLPRSPSWQQPLELLV